MCVLCWSGRCALDRRRVLRLGLGAAAANLALGPRMLSAHTAPERKLAFYNVHTGESLRTTYWAEGTYVLEGLAEINHLLRDFRTGDVVDINVGLLDLLWALRRRMHSRAAYHVISGYRSPETNAMLRRTSNGVAENSLHMEGMAGDVRLPGRDLARLRRAAVALKRGGVGYYPEASFIHVDVGHVRYW